MALDECETLPLLQQDTEPRSGRRATRRVLAAPGGDSRRAVGAGVLLDRPARGAARRVLVDVPRLCPVPPRTLRTPGRHQRRLRPDVQGLLGRVGLRVGLVVVRLPDAQRVLQGHVDGLEMDVPRYRARERRRMSPVRGLASLRIHFATCAWRRIRAPNPQMYF